MQIRSYFLSVFSCIQSEYRNIRTRNNSVFAQFSRSGFSRFSNCTIGTKSRKASHIFYYNNLIPASSLILVLKLSFFILILSTARHDANIRGGSRTAATSKMECFVITVNYYHKVLHLGCCSSPRSDSEHDWNVPNVLSKCTTFWLFVFYFLYFLRLFQRRNWDSIKDLRLRFLEKKITVISFWLVSQKIPSWMLDRVLNMPL